MLPTGEINVQLPARARVEGKELGFPLMASAEGSAPGGSSSSPSLGGTARTWGLQSEIYQK